MASGGGTGSGTGTGGTCTGTAGTAILVRTFTDTTLPSEYVTRYILGK